MAAAAELEVVCRPTGPRQGWTHWAGASIEDAVPWDARSAALQR